MSNHEENLYQLCKCGHRLGIHSWKTPSECLKNHFMGGDTERAAQLAGGIPCECKKFIEA